MDKLSGLASKFGEKKSEGEQPSESHQGSSSSDKDYLDKAFEAAQNKFGGGGSADTPEGRERNEKITDTAREKFEQYTGKEVPKKFSN